MLGTMQTGVLSLAVDAAIWGGAFALAAFCGAKISEALPDPNPPQATRPTAFSWTSAPLLAGIVGIGLRIRGLDSQGIAIACALSLLLTACARDEITRGKIRPLLLYTPLAAVLLAALMILNWSVLLGGLTGFLPFTLAIYATKGKGFSWDDAVLAGIGGMVLGMQNALLVLTSACLLAAALAKFRKKTAEPITFGPYLIVATAFGLVFSI